MSIVCVSLLLSNIYCLYSLGPIVNFVCCLHSIGVGLCSVLCCLISIVCCIVSTIYCLLLGVYCLFIPAAVQYLLPE